MTIPALYEAARGDRVDLADTPEDEKGENSAEGELEYCEDTELGSVIREGRDLMILGCTSR